jgi:hypothetical protein
VERFHKLVDIYQDGGMQLTKARNQALDQVEMERG